MRICGIHRHTGPCEAHRIDAISKIIAQLDPDVICLQVLILILHHLMSHWVLFAFLHLPRDIVAVQEVTHVTMEQLSETSWWEGYHRSRDIKTVQKGEEWYFTLLLLKASIFDLESCFLEKLFPNTIMGAHAHVPRINAQVSCGHFADLTPYLYQRF